jgi:hypothetical protein
MDANQLDKDGMAWIICDDRVHENGAWLRKGDWISVTPERAEQLIADGEAHQVDPPKPSSGPVITVNPFSPRSF